VAIAVI